MATTIPLPPVCTELRVLRDTEVARGEFRKRRLDDPLADYRSKFPASKAAANEVVEALDRLISRPADGSLAASFVSKKSGYAALRSLAATPISSDDLNTLLRTRLFDGRLLAVECKASNSEVNGYKRLNKEVVVDAGDWYRNFGQSNIVVAAALRGVFKPSNVSSAQRQGVYLFWWHRMSALNEFLSKAR